MRFSAKPVPGQKVNVENSSRPDLVDAMTTHITGSRQ
ncbi:hypothetical protein RKD21_000803 [Streptomyces albogriseolus]|uniref:Uncharacterized protein n=1 Tax=Streptomyces albogriseolus TaxID=1887 RepID=A0ACC6UGV3_STRAO